MSKRTRVLIAGGGIGGLALAQALHRDGLDVVVHERDAALRTRDQGYRIHINPDGNAALRACLPPEVFDLVRDTSGRNTELVAAYTHRMAQVMAQTFPDPGPDFLTHVDRETFRQSLFHGLDDIVRFGRSVAGYTITESGRVRVEFAEGGTDEGDILVGADGVGSAVRKQLLPHAEPRDLGLRCIYGRMPITEVTEPLIPADFDRGFCWVGDEHGCGAGFAPQRFRTRPEGRGDYLMTTLVATIERLGIPDERLFALTPEELWRLTIGASADWDASVRELFAHADPETFCPITIRVGDRIEPWRSGPVTVLGDAVHAISPTGGIGATTALQDAATLAAQLAAAGRGGKPLAEAVADYESVMLPRGFGNVEMSVAMAAQLFGQAV
ncbi:FAD-dependent oxidoreductase [Nocardia sp. NPDC088792]|uniref:FAD-dependent oxidoreductase n=1 Tax=Nocardia sp. NPDC088792 TaxID=3364332 RepID=UPI00380CDA02